MMIDIAIFDPEWYQRLITHIEDRLRHYPVNATQEGKWEFYSKLDESYRQPWIVDSILLSLFKSNLVLTGGFGEYVVSRVNEINKEYPELDFNWVLFNGKIRSGERVRILDTKITGYPFTWWLFDDSYYSGRTLLAIQHKFKEIFTKGFHTKIENCIIIYNGCHRWSPQVNSLYSWYLVHGRD